MTDLEEIYELYFPDLYKYTLSLCRNEQLAQELTQETFLKAVKGIDTFDGRCQLRVWLCQIAKHTYYTHYKEEKRFTTINMEDINPLAATLEERLANRADALEIHKVLHRLCEPHKEVFSLRVFGELSFREIGEIFGKSESWARVTFYRAKVKLREELK